MKTCALVLCALVGCGGSASRGLPDAAADAPAADAATGQYMGDVVGSMVPAEASVLVIWIVVSGSPDYIYKFGAGTSTGARYMASLPGALPAEAINSNGLAVGFLGLVPKNAQIADGKLDQNVLDPLILGASRNGIVFRTADSQLTGWPAAFRAGELACGRCITNTTGGNDTLEPAPCTELTIGTTNVQSCNVL